MVVGQTHVRAERLRGEEGNSGSANEGATRHRSLGFLKDQRGLFSNPILIGALTVLVTIVAVW